MNSARLNADLTDMGTVDVPVPPVLVHGPETQVTPGANTIKTINTAGSNFLLIIFGRGQNCGSLISVTTNPSDTVNTLSGSTVGVGSPSTAQILDARYVLNPTSNPGYEVNVAWTSGSCDYGSKFLTLYAFSGVNTSSPIVLNGVGTSTNFDGHLGFTKSFTAPDGFQLATFEMNHYENSLGSDDVHLKTMSGLTNSWGYESAATCSNSGAWCAEGGIGHSATATVNTNHNIDYAARSLFINGTFTSEPRSSVDTHFDYGTSPSFGQTTSTVARTTTGKFFADVTSLGEDTTYYFRACAESTCGATLTFHTQKDYLGVAIGGAWLFIFISAMCLLVLGALRVKRWREGRGL